MQPLRVSALGSLAILTLTYVGVLYYVTSVVAGTTRLTLAVLFAFGLSIWLAHSLDHRDAATVAAGFVLIGLLLYIGSTPGLLPAIDGISGLLRDILALMSGHTVLSILAVDVWALAVAPGPVFLSWYFAIREHYAEAAAVGLVLLIFFVLTGDASTAQAMIGVMGAGGAVGFGELDRRGAPIEEADIVVIVLAAMLVTGLAVSIVPGGGAQPVTPVVDQDRSDSTEAALLGANGELSVSSQATLDPTVRFTITAEEAMNWRVDAYDRYTGDGWVRTGEPQPFDPTVDSDGADRVALTVRAEIDGLRGMPAAWQPREVTEYDDVMQSPTDGLLSESGLDEGEEYTVISAQPNATIEELRAAGTDYPSGIEDRYTQLPDSMPDRVGKLTTNLTADDDSPYEAAETVEAYILHTNDYSLDVDVPDGDIADAQLFERDEGYCVYFATTMVAMLRSQDIPARLVTGYSSGERVDEDRWVVRGMNAHAWVEMYVPDVGWVAFDPTPSGAYDEVRQTALEEARQEGVENVDTNESGGEPWTPEPDEEPGNASDDRDTANASGNNTTEAEYLIYCQDSSAVDSGMMTEQEALAYCSPEQAAAMGVGDSPSGQVNENLEALEYQEQLTGGGTSAASEDEPGFLTERIALALALLVGGIAGARRTAMPDRLRYALGVRWQGRSADSIGAMERAWERLETYLEASYGGRRTGESVRAYVTRLDSAYLLDDRIIEVAETYERARYSREEVSPETATRAVAAVDGIVGTRIPRFWG